MKNNINNKTMYKIIKVKKNVTKYIKSSLLISSILLLSGCNDIVECPIEECHAHKYINKDGIVIYIEDEHEYFDFRDYERQDEYKLIDENLKNQYNFIKKEKLIRFSDNEQVINNMMKSKNDYLEYEYKDTEIISVPIGDTTVSIPETYYRWTTNGNHSRLTGKTRLCHYQYEAYKIVIDKNDNYSLISSGYVDNLNDVIEEYPFIKEDFYKIVHYENSYSASNDDMSIEESKQLSLRNI